MIMCAICGTQNEESARFCTSCGRKLTLPGTGHDFTTGVMRYEPDKADSADADQPPIYLNRQIPQVTPQQPAAPRVQIKPANPSQPVMQQPPAVPQQPTAPRQTVAPQQTPAVPQQPTAPQSFMPIGIPSEQTAKKGPAAGTIVVICMVAALVLLIVTGIAVLLSGIG